MPTVVHVRRAFVLGAALSLALTGALAAATSASAAGGRYVSLGDSYVSGPLIPTQSGGLCLRSSHNYPSLTAAALGLSLTDASCFGATTVEMTAAQSDDGLTINAPQLNSVTSGTSVVTLGIGGNDIGFINIIETCAEESLTNPFGSPCTSHYTSGGTDQLAASISATGPKVAAVLTEIHQLAPDARVYVVGYPDILPEHNNGCWPIVPIAYGDVSYLRQTEKGLDSMLSAEAAAHGATYVDTYTPTIGHDVCQAVGTKWIEGLVPTSSAAPFHPNALGEAAMARALESAIG
ncbi:SGNH/GDSL hydrolase family protein [Actinospica robiniae]|uniref:SGNH/GDSL hydrolase family protein n=1 Tax=Actinospica robiniae TaxID=304901 RepID=UPI0004159120|nr:SGNH/GDSL hydrolase family protein [Actinospica robiniae]